MVYPNQWAVGGQRQALGGVDPDHQGTGQAGAARDGNGIHVPQVEMGVFQGLFHHGINGADVLA